MSSGIEVLIGVFIVVLLALLAAICAMAGYAVFRMYRGFLQALAKLTETAGELTKHATALNAITTATESFADLPKLIRGHAKVAAHMTLEITRFRQATESFAGLISGQSDKPVPAYTVPDEAEKAREFELREWISDHPEHSREHAEQMVDSMLGETKGMGVE